MVLILFECDFLKFCLIFNDFIKQNQAFKVKRKIDNFKIMIVCRDEIECRIAEVLTIKKCRPSLNKQMLSQGASLYLKIFN